MIFVLFTMVNIQPAFSACVLDGDIRRCTFDDGSTLIACKEKLSTVRKKACENTIKRESRENRYYKQMYKRQCEGKRAESTEYCKDLKIKF